MLTFQHFLFESVKRAESAALVNARGFVSEHAVKHTLNHYHNQRQRGASHDQALQSTRKSLAAITKRTTDEPEVQKVAYQIPHDDIVQTASDSHAYGIHLINHLHSHEGGMAGPAVATGGMQSQTVKAHYGQESAADLLIPVRNGPHTHVGISLKYSASPKSATIKLNTPGAGIMHENLQQLHHAIFGQRNSELQDTWEKFSSNLKGSIASPQSTKFITHLKGKFKASFPNQAVPPPRSLLRKASRGVLGDEYKFDHAKLQQKASTKYGELGRKAYAESYAVKSDPNFMAYSGHAQKHLQKIFDHVQNTNDPAHIQAIHDFVHRITNTQPEEPKIKTLLGSINRGTSPSNPINVGQTISNKLKRARGQFSVSRKSHSNTIRFGGMNITWARNDPARGNPIIAPLSNLKGE